MSKLLIELPWDAGAVYQGTRDQGNSRHGPHDDRTGRQIEQGGNDDADEE